MCSDEISSCPEVKSNNVNDIDIEVSRKFKYDSSKTQKEMNRNNVNK
jgi:hypothetical protein